MEAPKGPCDQVQSARGTAEFEAMYAKLVGIRTLTQQTKNMHFLL